MTATLILYRRRSLVPGRRGWAWRLVAENGHVVATDGGQGYANLADAETVARNVVGGRYAVNVQIERA